MGYSLRQGLANLHRPNNQTTTLLLALGMGTFVISTLYFVQSAILSQAAFSGKGDRANMVLFDVQPDQKAGVLATMEAFGLPVLGDVSVVTMRLQSINGRTVSELMADSTRGREDWALRAELRSTYRSRPSASEIIIQGAFRGEVTDTVYVSVADRYADALGLSLGDRMEFDVQGAPLAAYVGSIRQIRWQSFEPNFLTVFPAGVLEGAPQFSVLMTRTRSADESARFQRALVAAYPGVSIVDLALVLETVGSVLDEITLVIRFMALFTIVTGLVIMVSSLTASRSQRMREAVLLRTIGARRRSVRAIMVAEYLTLGLLAALLGTGLAWLAAWILSASVFDVPFLRPPAEVLLALAIIPVLTVAVGAIGSRRLFEHPPLEALRADG
jgi:putative ABC transport system permease protein